MASSLTFTGRGGYFGGVTTLAEIEAAITTLSPEETAQLETFLRGHQARQAEDARLKELYRRTGFSPLPKRSDEVVTIEFVRQLCEEEGV